MTTRPRKSRNSLLSAYYGLSSQPPRSPLSQATHLTKTLPLSDLLQHSTILRQQTQSTRSSLHASVHDYYTHLLSTRDVSHSVSTLKLSLNDAISALSSTTAVCAAVNARLTDARKDVDRLDGARRATLLKSAAQVLELELEPAYRELADLCTDPEPARQRLFLLARRACVVLPAIRHLAEENAEFAEHASGLERCVAVVRDDIAKQVGDRYGLGVVDAVKLRKLLGEEEETLREAFFDWMGKEVMHLLPSEARWKGLDAVSIAREYVESARDRILPRLVEVELQYEQVFEGRGGEQFVVWLSDLLDECVAGRVRRGLKDGVIDMAQVEKMLEGIDELVTRSRGQIGGVVRAMAEGLKTGVLGEVRKERDRKWQIMIEEIMNGETEKERVGDVMDEVNCIGGKWGDIGIYAVQSAGADIERMGKAGWILKEMGRKIYGKEGDELRFMGDLVFCRIREEVLGRAEGILRARMATISKIGNDLPRNSSTGTSGVIEAVDVGSIVRMMLQTDKAGEEYGVRELCIGRGSERDFLLGEDDSLTAGVALMWLEIVREGSIACEAGVHALQLDGREVGERVGRAEMFERICLGGLERCGDGNAVLLSAEQVEEACRQRAASRGR